MVRCGTNLTVPYVYQVLIVRVQVDGIGIGGK